MSLHVSVVFDAPLDPRSPTFEARGILEARPSTLDLGSSRYPRRSTLEARPSKLDLRSFTRVLLVRGMFVHAPHFSIAVGNAYDLSGFGATTQRLFPDDA